MAKYDDLSKIAVTVTVNHTQRTISARRTGDRCPLAYIQTVSPSALAGVYRDAAAYFLDLAAQQERMHEIGTAHTLQKQAEIMLSEHRPLFEGVTA